MTIHDPWRDLIAEPVTHDHLVQVYREERVLVESVALFTGAAVGRNEAVVLVATREHRDAILHRLERDGFDVAALEAWGQITALDAQELLSRFMVGGQPDEARFKAVMRDLIATAKAGRFRNTRVYGEMVNLLWSENLPAATRLEELWNAVIEEHSITLFCAYGLHAGGEPERTFPRQLMALHTHMIPLEGCA